MARILMVASEAVPFAKTGGLGDMIGSLPVALRRCGDEVAVVLPRYGRAPGAGLHRVLENHGIWLGSRYFSVDFHLAEHRGVTYYLVDCPYLYDRGALYGFPDDPIRFAVLCQAALAVARRLYRPQVVHCHDWQAALVPVYLRHTLSGDPTFAGVRSLFTIHNLGYQGRFDAHVIARAGLPWSLFRAEALEFHGGVNLMKGGILYADAISTVSRVYAREIQTPDYGWELDGVLRARSQALTGILNGADYEEWNPATDRFLAANYSAGDLSGKRACKEALLREFGLPANQSGRPLAGIVSRLAYQKGFDLLEPIAAELAGEDFSLVVLGTGEARYEEMFRALVAARPDRFAARFEQNERLAHMVEAGADLFLMPSRYEPAGLNQLYSLRYGTVPLVRATGGLEQSIDETTGFKFLEISPQALLDCLRAALAEYRDADAWRARMIRGMGQDFSWKASAAEYSALYGRLIAVESFPPLATSL